MEYAILLRRAKKREERSLEYFSILRTLLGDGDLQYFSRICSELGDVVRESEEELLLVKGELERS